MSLEHQFRGRGLTETLSKATATHLPPLQSAMAVISPAAEPTETVLTVPCNPVIWTMPVSRTGKGVQMVLKPDMNIFHNLHYGR